MNYVVKGLFQRTTLPEWENEFKENFQKPSVIFCCCCCYCFSDFFYSTFKSIIEENSNQTSSIMCKEVIGRNKETQQKVNVKEKKENNCLRSLICSMK